MGTVLYFMSDMSDKCAFHILFWFVIPCIYVVQVEPHVQDLE